MMGGKGAFGLCFGCRRGGLLQDPLVHSRDEHPQVEGAWDAWERQPWLTPPCLPLPPSAPVRGHLPF